METVMISLHLDKAGFVNSGLNASPFRSPSLRSKTSPSPKPA